MKTIMYGGRWQRSERNKHRGFPKSLDKSSLSNNHKIKGVKVKKVRGYQKETTERRGERTPTQCAQNRCLTNFQTSILHRAFTTTVRGTSQPRVKNRCLKIRKTSILRAARSWLVVLQYSYKIDVLRILRLLFCTSSERTVQNRSLKIRKTSILRALIYAQLARCTVRTVQSASAAKQMSGNPSDQAISEPAPTHSQQTNFRI